MKMRDNKKMLSNQDEKLKKENKKQPWAPFFHLLKSVKLPWLLIILCVLLQLTQGYLTLLFPQYTERIYAGEFTTALAFMAIGVVLGKSIITAIYQFIARYTSHLNHMSFQNYIWKKISRLPISYFSKNEPRELISRTTTDTLTLSEFLSFNISSFMSIAYTFIGSFLLITQYEWRLGISQLISLPLCYIVGIVAGRLFFKFNNQIQTKLADMTRYFSTILPYLTLVKLFGQEIKEEKIGNKWIEKYAKKSFDYTLVNSAVSFANTITSVLQELLIIMMGVWLIQEGSIDVGVWIAFYMYANTLYNSFRGMMAIWQNLKLNQGACARISAVTTVKEEENPGTLSAAEAEGNIVFDQVSFSYDEKLVFQDVNFEIESGKVTAIVGASGTGKTTILSLLERFYQPQSGNIYWGKHKAEEYELSSWRSAIGYIPQDTKLMSGTIRDNITYGMTGKVEEEQLIEAAKQADAYDFIMDTKQGFDTFVGENGAKLSGGQRQRIAIARALLRDAKFLLLDEATSNLDAESCAKLRDTLDKLSKTKTILMVAHNLNSIKNADKIIVMDHTCIKGEGTHEELMEKNELYRSLVELQAAKMAM